MRRRRSTSSPEGSSSFWAASTWPSRMRKSPPAMKYFAVLGSCAWRSTWPSRMRKSPPAMKYFAGGLFLILDGHVDAAQNEEEPSGDEVLRRLRIVKTAKYFIAGGLFLILDGHVDAEY